MGLLDGKVAVVSGAARGQGRAHAVRLAREGADIIVMDICADIDTTVSGGAFAKSSIDRTSASGARVEAEVDVVDGNSAAFGEYQHAPPRP